MRVRCLCPVILALAAWWSAGAPVARAAEPPADTVAARRNAVLALAARGTNAIPLLEQALRDEHPLVRRAAIRALADQAPLPREALSAAQASGDPVVRRAALLALAADAPAADLPVLERALADADPLIRLTSVRLLLAAVPRTDAVAALLRRAADDPSDEVRGLAASALAADEAPFDQLFQREVVLLKDRPDMADHVQRIATAQRIPLPREGWRWRADDAENGHRDKWFDPAYDDSVWTPAAIETPWEGDHTGVAWYRLRTDLPPKPDHAAVELAFDAVDEEAWVWVNGIYVGAHAIGLAGWNKPFRLDVTREVRWDAPNVVAVRVRNSKGAGGIYKPVTWDVLIVQ